MSNQTNQNTTDCPHCGAKFHEFHPVMQALDGSNYKVDAYECGSKKEWRSPLCHEHEARQKAEAENAKLREIADSAISELEEAAPLLHRRVGEFAEHLRDELAKLRHARYHTS
jgi:DNA repair exonuclease SbcCD ATPase subunit